MELKDVKNKVIQMLEYEDERGFTHEHSKYIAVDPDGDAYVYGDKPIWVYEQEWWEGQGEIFTYLGNIEDSVEDAYRALWSIKELEDDTADNTDCLQINSRIMENKKVYSQELQKKLDKERVSYYTGTEVKYPYGYLEYLREIAKVHHDMELFLGEYDHNSVLLVDPEDWIDFFMDNVHPRRAVYMRAGVGRYGS